MRYEAISLSRVSERSADKTVTRENIKQGNSRNSPLGVVALPFIYLLNSVIYILIRFMTTVRDISPGLSAF